MEDIWVPYMKIYKQEGEFDTTRFTERGMYVTKTERERIKEVIVEAIRSLILPWVEKKFKKLSASNTPKKRFTWFSKESASALAVGDKPTKPDWELRFAGDLAFLLQDYNSAVTHYKRLFDRIYKGTAYEEIGSCKEFITIASLITETSRKDFRKNMEIAAQYYEKGNNLTLLVRNAIYTFEILTLARRYIEAGEYIARAVQYVTREAELPALLMEQAAFSTIKDASPLMRKFAHYMVFAGTFYFDQGFIHNAIYCLGISYHIYEKPNWPETLIYLCNKLGSALADANDLEHSFIFYKKLLDVSITWRGEGRQDIFLQVFLRAAEKLKNSVMDETNPFLQDKKEKLKEVLQMHTLLKIIPESLELFTSQDQIYCNDERRLFHGKYDMAQLKDLRQIQLEMAEEDEEVSTEGVYNNSQSWMALGKMLDGDLSNPFENSMNPKQKAREEMLRDLWFYDEKQPKRKAIMYCKRKRFVHALEPIFVKFVCKNPLGAPIQLTQLKVACHYAETKADSEQQDESNLEVQNDPIVLKADEEREIVLWVLPKEEGELCIDGIQWEISSLVGGSYKMSEVTGKTDPVSVLVRGKTGQLEITTDYNLRLNYLDGEVDYYTLRLKNTGHLPISQISFQTDYPLLLGWKSLSFDWVLNPTEEKELKIYLRAGFMENTKKNDALMPRVLIRYLAGPEDAVPLFYRYKRIEHYFGVNHSFVIKNQCIRSYKNLNEYLLNVQIEKLYARSESFYLNELCVVGQGWKIVEKQQFTGFDKVFNTFLSLIHSPNETVPLKHKRIILGKREPLDLLTVQEPNKAQEQEDITSVEPYENYIKEYQDVRANKYQRESMTVTTVDILATWTLELGKHVAKGAHLIPITLSSYENSSTSKSIKTKAPSKLELFPLQIVHECPNTVTHNFASSPLCKVPLRLLLKNASYLPASFRFEALRIQREARDKSTNFLWQGPATKNVVGLEPNEQREILLEACMMAPGVYDLNRFAFTFFRNPATGTDLDPSGIMPKNVAMKIYALEFEQIFVTITTETKQSKLPNLIY
eukprot:TRINITY_DN136028_c0_g1_i1.p1 TRINITY_DN136028_c0_g1~~TRINITY_DN136028_c0_g1_i1.p1  ORF type:complete len:1040 (+),score=107.72 TRINITY_DN136028_c0_g1_i1:896-4015(+)